MRDQSRNLSIANSTGFRNSFSFMKENQDQNIVKSLGSQPNNSGILNSKLFKFKKKEPMRHLGDHLGSNPFSNLINIEGEQQTPVVEGATNRKISS